MVEEKKLFKLDIACGQNKKEGFVGLDIAKCEGVDIVHDLTTYPWPVEDASVEEAFCSHYIEHIPMGYVDGKDHLFHFFDELYRILAPGGKCYIIAPYYSSMRCWQDPTHRRAICDNTFFYCSAEWRKINKLDHYNAKCDLHAAWGYDWEPDWATRSDDARAFAARHYINVIRDIHVTLEKKA
jgi:SAM-dependent methyltransferase